MKKTTFCLLLAALASGAMHSQEINATVYGGYTFNDSFDSYYDVNDYYEGVIDGGLQWGLGLEYMLRPNSGIEFIYLRQDTHSPTTYLTNGFSGIQRTNFELDLNYFMLGGSVHFPSANAPIEGYVGAMAGFVAAKITNPDNGNTNNVTKFSWGLKAGAILWASETVGLKLQAQLLSAVQAVGGGFYFGGYGPQAGISTYSTFYQFTLGGGPVFKF